MRRILPIFALLIFISGCGLNQNTNNSNIENNSTSSSTSSQDSSKMTNLDSHLTVAKQALSTGVIIIKPSRRQQLLLRIIQIMQTLIRFVALLRL